MKFKARFSNIIEWKSVMLAVDGICHHAIIRHNKNGMALSAVDPSQISLIEVTFPKTSFQELSGDFSSMCIKIDELKNVFDTVSDDSSLELELSNSKNLKISVLDPFEMVFTLKLLKIESHESIIPKLNHKSNISLNPETMIKIISNFESITQYITINCKKDKIQFCGKGESANLKINLQKGISGIHEVTSKGNSSSEYILEHMAQVIRNIGKNSKLLKMAYGTKSPIQIFFEFPSETTVEYFLAPTVSN